MAFSLEGMPDDLAFLGLVTGDPAIATRPVIGPPVNPWMMETGSMLIWGALVLVTAALAFRNGKLPLLGLCLIAATSAFWQEFFGDWGAYVAWNPAFARLPLWGHMAFTTPVKPVFIPFSWGWWFAVSLPLLVSLVSWLSRKLPGIAPGWIALATAFPLFLAYQLYVEGSSVANGWWTYDVVIGPALESARGRLPVVFPALLGLWVAWFVARLARRDEDGFWPHEHRWGVAAKPAGWRRELARAWAMIVLFQVSFFIINIAPAILGRALFGGPSALVP